MNGELEHLGHIMKRLGKQVQTFLAEFKEENLMKLYMPVQ